MTDKTFLVRIKLSDWAPVAAVESYMRGEIEQFTQALFEFHGKGTCVLVQCVEVKPATVVCLQPEKSNGR